MNSSLLKKIDYLYNEITAIEEQTKNSFSSSFELHQENLDFSYLYDEFKEILCCVLDVYKSVFRSSYAHKAKKVFYTAICEMIKQDFYRGMLITFKNVTNSDILNNARYYDLLDILSKSQGLSIEVVNGRRQFEKAFILETGIPRNMSKNVMKMFKIYWRYFHEIDKEKRLQLFYQYINGSEFSDEYIIDNKEAELFEKYRAEVIDYSEKVFSVFQKLDDIFSALDEYYNIRDNNQDELFVEEINAVLGYDITKVLRDSDIQRIFAAYLRVLSISKFKKVLTNLPRNERIETPAGYLVTAEQAEKNITCGIYKIRGNKYEVVIDPTITLEDMIGMSCNQVHTLGVDYYCYLSRDYYDIEVDGKIVYPRELFYHGQNRYVWMGKIGEASRVDVDGNTILSSQNTKIAGRIIKQFDYEKKISRLVYYLQGIKVNEPDKPYGKLTYSINNKEKLLICVGNNLGIYYRDNIRIPVSDDVNTIDFYLDEELLETISVVLENVYLFDKWNGTRYYSGKDNGQHSGAIILFSRHVFECDGLVCETTSQYEVEGYYVYELNIPYGLDKIIVFDQEYRFDSLKTPYFFIKSEIGNTETVERIEDITVKMVNLDCEKTFWFEIENERGKIRTSVDNGEYLLSEMYELDAEKTCGKWSCSLWEKQRKIREESFVVIPEVTWMQEDICILEGKDVHVKITANEKCFINSVGELTEFTDLNLGPINIELDENGVVEKTIRTSVYIDKWNIIKELDIRPSVWGVRVKNTDDHVWRKKESININLDNDYETKCAVFSTGNNDLYVNGNLVKIGPGYNEILWQDYLDIIKRKNDLVLSDDRNSCKQIFVCIPNFTVHDLSIGDEAILSLRYSGPVSETLTVRYFIDGELQKSFMRDAIKNSFLLHVLLGNLKNLNGKRVSVEIASSTSYMPVSVFDEVIAIDEANENDNFEEKEAAVNSVKQEKKKAICCSDLVYMKSISEYYYKKRNEKSIIENDIVDLMKNMEDLYNGNIY